MKPAKSLVSTARRLGDRSIERRACLVRAAPALIGRFQSTYGVVLKPASTCLDSSHRDRIARQRLAGLNADPVQGAVREVKPDREVKPGELIPVS